MNPTQYREAASSTALSAEMTPEEWFDYLADGFVSEVGEIAGESKRVLRDDRSGSEITKARAERFVSEVGDLAWYLDQFGAAAGAKPLGVWPQPMRRVVPLSRLSAKTVLRTLYRETVLFLEAFETATPQRRAAIVETTSLWRVLVTLAAVGGSTLDEVTDRNAAKLAQRKTDGTLQGHGETRTPKPAAKPSKSAAKPATDTGGADTDAGDDNLDGSDAEV